MLFLCYVDCTSMRVLSFLYILIHFNERWYYNSILHCIVFCFICIYWVFRISIWIVNWVWHVQCHTCDNVVWINGTGLSWRFVPSTTGHFNNGRLQGVTRQKTIIWTQHHENIKLIKAVVLKSFVRYVTHCKLFGN